jgi:polysaccharide pyruvyl transferase WcaK-like protein
MVKPDVSALAEKAIDLLEHVQLNKRCVLSDVHKKSLFALLDAIKQHVSNGNQIPTTDN